MPLAFPAVGPFVAKAMLAVAALLLLAAVVLWLFGLRHKAGSEPVAANQVGPGNQFSGSFTQSPIHIGDNHNHVAPVETQPDIDQACWFTFVVMIKPQEVDRRKYIYHQTRDYGAIELYISKANRFTVLITDKSDEEYSLEAAEGRRGVPLNELVAISIEVLWGINFTKISIYLDSELLAERKMPFRVEVGTIEGQMIFAADSNGKNNGALSLYEHIYNDTVLTKEQKAEVLLYFKNKYSLLG